MDEPEVVKGRKWDPQQNRWVSSYPPKEEPKRRSENASLFAMLGVIALLLIGSGVALDVMAGGGASRPERRPAPVASAPAITEQELADFAAAYIATHPFSEDARAELEATIERYGCEVTGMELRVVEGRREARALIAAKPDDAVVSVARFGEQYTESEGELFVLGMRASC